MTIESRQKFKTPHNLRLKIIKPVKYLERIRVADEAEKPYYEFILGTCRGIFYIDEHNYNILAVVNHAPHNGHFDDVLMVLYHRCVEDKKNLRFLEVINDRFKKYLERNGYSESHFEDIDGERVSCMVKTWDNMEA